MEQRFYYNQSVVYGWCVYDRDAHHQPAYNACAELLPPVRQDENGTVTESPILMKSEYSAMRLCAKLNMAYKRQILTIEEVNEILVDRGWNKEGREIILEDMKDLTERSRTRKNIMRIIEDYEDR